MNVCVYILATSGTMTYNKNQTRSRPHGTPNPSDLAQRDSTRQGPPGSPSWEPLPHIFLYVHTKPTLPLKSSPDLRIVYSIIEK